MPYEPDPESTDDELLQFRMSLEAGSRHQPAGTSVAERCRARKKLNAQPNMQTRKWVEKLHPDDVADFEHDKNFVDWVRGCQIFCLGGGLQNHSQ